MQAQSDCETEVKSPDRVWFFPDKFWRATQHMSPDEAANLMAEVEKYAEAGDTQALRKYPFIAIGNPYKKKRNDQSAA